MGEQFITPEGIKKIKEELKELKTTRRPELIQRIKDARELGDLSENADYQSAKEEQSFLDGHILELEDLLKHAVVVKKNTNTDKVGISSHVKIITAPSGSKFNVKTNPSFEYTITGPKEADPLSGKISNESPLGKEIIDRKVGEEFSITTPNGEQKYKILEIK